MNLKEYIKHIKSICNQGILRHKNVILDETFQKELLEIIKCYEQLQQENQSLNKQLEDFKINQNNNPFENSKYRNTGFMEGVEATKTKYINQQKEFIDYLEDLIKQNETVVEVSKYGLPKNCSKLLIDFYKEILSKYKEIIGVSDENNK